MSRVGRIGAQVSHEHAAVSIKPSITGKVGDAVVDFDIAKSVIEADLKGTEFADYTRIYDEGAEKERVSPS